MRTQESLLVGRNESRIGERLGSSSLSLLFSDGYTFGIADASDKTEATELELELWSWLSHVETDEMPRVERALLALDLTDMVD